MPPTPGIEEGQAFQFVNEQPLKLTIEERVLLFAVLRDMKAGRTGSANDAYEDTKEAIFMFSSGFVHFSDFAFYNVSYWSEFEEYRAASPAPAHVGHARLAVGARKSFNIAIRKLVRSNEAWAFVNAVRAISGLGQKTTPLLQLWNEANRNKPKDIVAYSLREADFKRARMLAEKCSQVLPWQLHERIAQDRAFSKALTGKG